MKKKISNINISVLSVILFLMAAGTMILSCIEVYRIGVCLQEQTDIVENRRACERHIQKLAGASDYLTREAWHFIAAGNMEHLENYWNEIYNVRTREQAVQELKNMDLPESEIELAEEAKMLSDQLAEGEAWAMRMVTEALGINPEELPAGVAEIRLSPEEELLTPEGKRQAALDYIFGREYAVSKSGIESRIDGFIEVMRQREEREMTLSLEYMKQALGREQIFDIGLLFYLLLGMGLFYVLAVRPFQKYSQRLKQMGSENFAPLEPMGVQETRELARVFNDIYSDWQSQRKRLEEERFRFHVAVENTAIIVYEYNPNTDVYTAYGTLKKVAGENDKAQMEQIIPDFLREKAADFVGEDSVPCLRKLVEDEGGSLEVQIVSGDRTIWTHITATPVFDDKRHMARLIGKIVDIQTEKENELALEEMRSRDHMTGVYNKETGVRLIQEYMLQKSPDEVCALMILDMDNFTEINDVESNVFADAVLQDVAEVLRACTGPEDILVRLGGDEFMMFIKECTKSRAGIVGPKIAAAVRALSPIDNESVKISASIGMCVTAVVDEYSGLYRCAESTLKYVKAHKKGGAACYMDTSNELGVLLTQMYPDRHAINKIDRPVGSREDLIAFALDLLGKSRNLDDAVFLLLARVGKQYNLDRVTILDVNIEYLTCHFSYQWVKNSSDSQNGRIEYVSREELGQLAKAYDEEGLCERFVITNLSKMKSIVHAAIWNHGVYSGNMSFEKKREGYVWSKEERRILSELVRIISSFTLKARADAVSQAKTDFLSRMSHEIRTPMNAITGMTAIAKSSLGDVRKTMDCLNKIESANTYLLSLINGILDMSRIESGKMELHLRPVDLDEELENLNDLVRSQAEAKGIHFRIENRYDNSRRLLADDLRLSQVLVNLLGNAVKFTDIGGSITLKVEVVERRVGDVLLRFGVEDTGIGIDEQAQMRIFNAFEQETSDTAVSYGGTGLGLSISSRLVQLMGGVLEVRSKPEEGSEFFFTIWFAYAPKDGTSWVQPTIEHEAETFFDPHGKMVLIAEDNELNREIAREILEMEGFAVETAEDGSQAAELFRRSAPGYYDAVLMDIRMPVMNGFESARRIRTMGHADSRNIPIIAMTANAFDEDMKRSLENGMNGHLSKPIEVKRLLETLQRCISAVGRGEKGE